MLSAGILLVTAALRAAALALALLLVAALTDLASPLPLELRRLAILAAVMGGSTLFVILLFRGRHAFRLPRVALYLEERKPELEFALVTALEAEGAGAAALEQAVDRAAPDGLLRATITRSIGGTALLLLLTLLGLYARAEHNWLSVAVSPAAEP